MQSWRNVEDLYDDQSNWTDGWVEVRYRNQIKLTTVIIKDDNPKWSEIFEVGPNKIDMKNKLKSSVYNEYNYWNRMLLQWETAAY